MRHYYIYLIENEVARSFFGKEAKLFQLFVETFHTHDPFNREQLHKQVAYITKKIPVHEIETNIQQQLASSSEFTVNQGEYMIHSVYGQSMAKLAIDHNVMHMEATGDLRSETVFFEVLRNIDPCFLAIDAGHQRFGWLAPVKHAHLI
ncbi:sporulation inhibitor of replication protein SirA [Tuberibacillus sp. Marseille-P3662]|uniref:sporulation inhibitor of replication protein SirA n=1 Tax=Tuberibacillus sp. Marseille-P3662 TaxID=1965358 RepID=UPI0015930659|nr:sporulation inhibitor of replication protein SirA [Tuberibacillus sp. Marseille-P3662]